jgi:cobyrinic acid a,c-diamide synthase
LQIPRLVIAGTNSGCGKTTITLGILAALVQSGLRVQPFKVGPDYLDPMLHTFVTKTPARNLDSWLLKEKTLSYLFQKSAAGKDLAVIEGVMGLYDGLGGDSQLASTAHVAGIIGAPVVLVVNGAGMSLSLAALIRGFRDFDPTVKLKGVIINNINQAAYFQHLKGIIETHTGIKALGYLPSLPEVTFPGRHLGLIPSGEISDLAAKINGLAAQVARTIDLEMLLAIAREAEAMAPAGLSSEITAKFTGVRLAVANDAAFNFYYRDNLDLFEMLGAELVYFSPLADSGLPAGLDGLYLGGGFPEVWAEQLQANAAMRGNIKQAVAAGLPTYAECGGLLYLTAQLQNHAGTVFEMAGALPAKSEMTTSLQHFGYVEIKLTAANVLGKPGGRIRGHEFHYSVTQVDDRVSRTYQVAKAHQNKGVTTWEDGYQLHNLLAAYPHLHFWSNPAFAERFLARCQRERRQKAEGGSFQNN